jgi:phosphoglycolate phosphatase-like HAD superfamily hydrolase
MVPRVSWPKWSVVSPLVFRPDPILTSLRLKCRNADLRFDVLYTSDLVGHFKPHPNTYKTVIKSLGFDPSEYAMVASHAYDLEAAQKCGMRAIYTHRSTEDVGVDLSKYGFDLVVEDKGAFHNVKNELEKLRMRG